MEYAQEEREEYNLKKAIKGKKKLFEKETGGKRSEASDNRVGGVENVQGEQVGGATDEKAKAKKEKRKASRARSKAKKKE